MSLHKSWEDKIIDYVDENFTEEEIKKADINDVTMAYLEGASDFQKRVIENILTYRNGFKEKEITYKAISNILQIIKNLKAE